MQGTPKNTNITVNEASGGEDKIIYTFRIPIWRPSWIFHFTQAIYYITLQIYFGYNLICISASSVSMNYFCNELGVVEVKVTQTMNRHNPLKV